MGETKEIYQVTNVTKADINRVLMRLTNRLDQLEGYRGTPTFQAPIEFAEEATLESPTIDTPTINEGTLESPTINTPTIESPTINTPTIDNPTFTNYSILHYSNTSVFSGTSPTSWTDLDLSSIVGENYAIAYLRIYSPSANLSVKFRVNGETKDIYYVTSGITTCSLSSGMIAYLLIPTDSNGICEWAAYSAESNVSLKIIFYLVEE